MYTKFPEFEKVLIEFMRFGKAELLTVTSWIIRERARKEVQTLDILNFHGSRGWVEMLLHRSSLQSSFRLHSKGDVILPTDHAERMREIREILSQ